MWFPINTHNILNNILADWFKINNQISYLSTNIKCLLTEYPRDKKNVEEEEHAEVLDRLLHEKLPDKC